MAFSGTGMNPDFVNMLLAWDQGRRPPDVEGFSPEKQMQIMSQFPAGYKPGQQWAGMDNVMQPANLPMRKGTGWTGLHQNPLFRGDPRALDTIGQNFNMGNWSPASGQGMKDIAQMGTK
jgi:hypothetical protein